MVSHKLLGQLLVERGLLPEDDLQKALALQRERKGRLGKILLDLGYVSQQDLQIVLSEQLGIARVDPAELQEVPMEAATLPSGFLRQSLLYPYRVDDGTVLVAMADPLESDNIRAIEQLMGRKVEVRLASEAAILKALDIWLGGEQTEEGVVAADSDESPQVVEAEAADIDQLRDLASEAHATRPGTQTSNPARPSRGCNRPEESRHPPNTNARPHREGRTGHRYNMAVRDLLGHRNRNSRSLGNFRRFRNLTLNLRRSIGQLNSVLFSHHVQRLMLTADMLLLRGFILALQPRLLNRRHLRSLAHRLERRQ